MKKACMIAIVSLLSLSMFSMLAPQVKACRVPEAGALDPWPMFHHDSGHTGFSPSSAPNANNVLWTFQAAGMIKSSPAVVAGKVFVGTDNSFYALDQIHGNLKWSRGDIVSYWSSPAVDHGLVFICDDYTIYALEEGTGRTRWSYPLDLGSDSSPIFVDNLVVVGDADGIYALNEKTGAKVWNFSMRLVLSSVAEANGMIFAVNFGGSPCSLVALNAHTGGVVWSRSLDYLGSFVASPAVADGMVFVSVITDDFANGYVLAFDQFNGHTRWQSIETGIIFSSPAVGYSKVFVGSYDGNVYAFDEKKGRLIWSYATGGSIESSSPAVADNKVFIGSDDSYVYALNQHTGTLLWRLETGGWVYSSPAIANGALFTGSLDGKLYAVGNR
jgi:outer membrane protein assembly factor BamB